ncbi:sporulation membrane protein YtaF [Caldalkalibacillus salinus]|uniref:sporulation membrane protein YtaF n=1 Tax=Caldalkalibacillus salinus TaxID=2803787 RepID=UPI00192331B9
MIQIASLLVLSFAVSLDSFGVGITYGLRRVTIPLKSIFIIAICSGTSIVLAMAMGQGMSYMISPQVAEMIGGFILVMIGIWALYNISKPSKESTDARSDAKDHSGNNEATVAQEVSKVWTIEIKKLGIVIHVLRKPMMADIDRSGVISGVEAFVLGIALSLDAFGAGIGAALLGYSPLATALIMATMSSSFVYLGLRVGAAFSTREWMAKLSYIPGVILILFGLIKIF